MRSPSPVTPAWPGRRGLVPRGKLSSPFGPRGAEGVHAGIDVAAPVGTPVSTPLSGTVIDLSRDGERTGYGNVVIVQHGPTLATMYAHLDRFAPELAVGSRIVAGQPVGFVGATHAPETRFMAPHLHFEVHTDVVRTPSGRVIVNPSTPSRLDPYVWLTHHGFTVSDSDS